MNNTLRNRLQNVELIIGLLIILGFLVVAVMAPVLAPPTGDYPELTYIIPRDGYKDSPLPPNPDHPLGTLPDQYDIYYGIIWGTRRAFIVGLSITFGRALIGVILGLISGYYKGLLSNLIMRVTDAFMSMPSIAAAALMFALFGELAIPFFQPGGAVLDPASLLQNENRNVRIIVLSLILFGWMQYARLIRANMISEREREYVQAVKSVGASNRRVIFKHMLPNVVKGLYVLIASDIGSMVAVVSLFYFIGLIGKYPYGLTADWGQILSVSRDWIVGPPSRPFLYWYTYFPAISVIALFTIAWSMVGDGLRDFFDPRLSLRKRRKKRFSFLTKWFRRFSQTQKQAAVYPTILGLNVEIPPDESEPDPVLRYARGALKREDLSEALHAYTHLVWDGKNVGTVIRDLQAITWKYPGAIEAWSILGEALKQIGREQDAQQAFAYYRKLKERGESNHKGNLTWIRSLVLLGLPVLAIGLFFITFGMSMGNMANEDLPSSPTFESLAESIDPLPTITPTEIPWGLYLPTPLAARATRTPTPTDTPGVADTLSTASLTVQSTVAFAACIPDNPPQIGRVVDIIDGNTIKVFIGEYVYVVRYIGVEVPDTSEPNGMEAEYKNADLVYQKEITLIPDQTDKDARGRLLRYVLVGDTFVNYELVAQGLAQAADAPPNSACAEYFQGAEQ
jgi:peptide/nickel transport system permease protein